MWTINLTKLAAKQIRRNPVRSLLTVLGISTGMFLYTCVETMQSGMKASTELSDKDSELIVYRKDRFCLFTSKMPEHYSGRMSQVKGVKSVVPMKILLNNCGTSLDIIAMRGIGSDDLKKFEPTFTLLSGSIAQWHKRNDAAIIGDSIATRRKLSVGDLFESAGVTVSVAGIMESDDYQLKNAAFVHKDFLQQSSKDGLGIVTQFNVQVEPGADGATVCRAIDDEFASDTEPTYTRTKQEFIAKTADELVKLISFTRWVALAAVLVVLTLVANTISMAVRSRIKENAILQTIGYNAREIMFLVIVEGVILGFVGGLIATAGVFLFLHFGNFSLSSEGATIVFFPDFYVIASGLMISLLLGLVAGIFPAYRASRSDIVDSLRMVC